MEKILSGQVAVVTGGSRGIGKAISLELAKNGAFVYVNYSSNSAAAEETVRLCKDAGGDAEAISFNVANSEAVTTSFEQMAKKTGRIDILVNNAGISKDGLFVRFKDEEWHELMRTNLDGTFFCSRIASKFMMKQRCGRIINMSSVVGEMGNAGQVAYVSTKAAVIGFTKALARELASRGVTVNAIAPGFIETDMTEALPEDRKKEVLSQIPLARYGSAEEVAKLTGFLAGKDSGYITGQIIGINGGMYM